MKFLDLVRKGEDERNAIAARDRLRTEREKGRLQGRDRKDLRVAEDLISRRRWMRISALTVLAGGGGLVGIFLSKEKDKSSSTEI